MGVVWRGRNSRCFARPGNCDVLAGRNLDPGLQLQAVRPGDVILPPPEQFMASVRRCMSSVAARFTETVSDGHGATSAPAMIAIVNPATSMTMTSATMLSITMHAQRRNMGVRYAGIMSVQ